MTETEPMHAVQTPLADLKPHPKNYRKHPPDQLAHIKASIVEHGHYRNVVAARDGTILAGHGVVQATKALGLPTVPVVRLDIASDDPRALRLLVGDNEIGHLAEIGDRQLSELLRDLRASDDQALLGTGYDDAMLANMLMVTRPKSEIGSIDEAAEWAGAGMPDYEPGQRPLNVCVNFASETDRQDFARRLGYTFTERTKSCWWPPRSNDDPSSVRFE